VGSRGKAPGQGVRRTSSPEADDDLLIQEQIFALIAICRNPTVIKQA